MRVESIGHPCEQGIFRRWRGQNLKLMGPQHLMALRKLVEQFFRSSRTYYFNWALPNLFQGMIAVANNCVRITQRGILSMLFANVLNTRL